MRTFLGRTSFLAPFSSFKPEPYTGISKDEALKLHQTHMFPFYKPYYKEPFFAVRGNRQYLYDDTGK